MGTASSRISGKRSCSNLSLEEKHYLSCCYLQLGWMASHQGTTLGRKRNLVSTTLITSWETIDRQLFSWYFRYLNSIPKPTERIWLLGLS